MRQKLEQLFLCFMLYSFLGWCYEVFLEVVVYRWGYSDRGVLVGPYCVVYGFGALLIIGCLSTLKRRRIPLGAVNITPVLVFLAIVALTTAVELAASYLMEWTTGGWMWDYTRFSPNFQGRIALNPSLRFGAGGMAILYLIQPFFDRLLNRVSVRSRSAAADLLGVLLAVDVAYTLCRL